MTTLANFSAEQMHLKALMDALKDVPGADKQISIEIVTITPEMALEMLATNTHNRPLKIDTMRSYARDMIAGRWKLTGEAIKFAPDGSLLDGQHRLQACVAADKPFVTIVMRGISPDAQEQMDVGKVRKMSDVLALRGVNLAGAMSAAANVLWGVLSGREVSGKAARRPSHQEILRLIEDHPKLADSVERTREARGVSRSRLAALHYIGAHILHAEADANAFVEVFRSGVPAYAGDPAHNLRERLMTTAHGQRSTGEAQWRLMVHAWNLFRKRVAVTHIKLRSGPVAIDGFRAKELGAIPTLPGDEPSNDDGLTVPDDERSTRRWPNSWRPDHDATLIRLRRAGATKTACAARMNFSSATIAKKCKELGV